MHANTDARKMPLWNSFFLLWILVYVLLFILTSQFGWKPMFLVHFVEWFGRKALHLSEFHQITSTGSGDTTFDYVTVAVIVSFSLLTSIVLVPLSRLLNWNTKNFYLFILIAARYYVGFTMLEYGLAKVFNGQFLPNGYYRLEENVGNMSPMGLVWTFMGASRSYTFISGLLECIGGILLFWRRTTAIGAILALVVMMNVMLLNYNYDVPVKIFSTHLVFLCLFILSKNFKSMWNFFILHKLTELRYPLHQFKKKWLKITRLILKYSFIIFLLGSTIYKMANSQKYINSESNKMEGAYQIQTMIFNGDTLRPSKDTSFDWDKLIFSDFKASYIIHSKKEKTDFFSTEYNSKEQIISLKKDTVLYANLHYQVLKNETIFKMKIGIDSIILHTTVKHKKDYRLNNRGFHWVNDYPYNR